MTGQANEIQWYIARDGKQHGPLTEIEMKTFVAHNYLRTTDLIWRPGMSEWQPAPQLFPESFEAAPAPAETVRPATGGQSASPMGNMAGNGQARRDANRTTSARQAPEPVRVDNGGSNSVAKRLGIAAAALLVVGGGAYAVVGGWTSGSGQSTDDPPIVVAPTTSVKVVPQPPKVQAAAPAQGPTTASLSANPVVAPPEAAPPAGTQVAVLAPQNDAPLPLPPVDGSPIDTKLQRVPVWALIKREYPTWYSNQVKAALKMSAEDKSDSEIALLLAQGLVSLRRQNADKALQASSEKLQQVAVAFLDHLKALRAQSVSACFGFISKGETSPAVVQMMENPETATALNAQAGAVFEAISEGARAPVKHDAALKSDYDMLIKELGKLGWKDEDLKVFSNPKLLAKREPEQVCKLVQEWFVAHLAVQDKAVRDRLLYETLKPVVSG